MPRRGAARPIGWDGLTLEGSASHLRSGYEIRKNRLGIAVARDQRLLAGIGPDHLLAARATRWLLLCGSLAAGLGLAFATYHLSANFGCSHSIIPYTRCPAARPGGDISHRLLTVRAGRWPRSPDGGLRWPDCCGI